MEILPDHVHLLLQVALIWIALRKSESIPSGYTYPEQFDAEIGKVWLI